MADTSAGADNSSAPEVRGSQFLDSAYASKIETILCDSAVLDFDRFNEKFDLIFIDGCHDYEYVKIDSENALNNIRKEGLIVWHDYGFLEPVSRVVDSYADLISLHAIRGTRLAIGINS